LKWLTATELNNLGFEVQRKTEANNFMTIGFVNGKGTTSRQQSYTFKDKGLNNGKYHYRLKQVDYNGSQSLSEIVEVEFRSYNSFMLDQNYPNPFNPVTTIGYALKEKSEVRLSILNTIGEEVAVLVNEIKDAGYYLVEFNAAQLPSGIYFYKLKAGEFAESKKLVLVK
jgi:hypothetical protein